MLALTQVNSFGQDKNRVTGMVFHDVNASGSTGRFAYIKNYNDQYVQ